MRSFTISFIVMCVFFLPVFVKHVLTKYFALIVNFRGVSSSKFSIVGPSNKKFEFDFLRNFYING